MSEKEKVIVEPIELKGKTHGFVYEDAGWIDHRQPERNFIYEDLFDYVIQYLENAKLAKYWLSRDYKTDEPLVTDEKKLAGYKKQADILINKLKELKTDKNINFLSGLFGKHRDHPDYVKDDPNNKLPFKIHISGIKQDFHDSCQNGDITIIRVSAVKVIDDWIGKDISYLFVPFELAFRVSTYSASITFSLNTNGVEGTGVSLFNNWSPDIPGSEDSYPIVDYPSEKTISGIRKFLLDKPEEE